MRHVWLRLVLVAALILIAARPLWRRAPAAGVGAQLPALSLARLDGASVALDTLRGRLVVLNFWATWCPPCVSEMPSLERLHQVLGSEGLSVVGISVDEDSQALASFLDARGITFLVLRDPGGRQLAALLGVTGYPHTFVVEPSGRVAESYPGPAEWDSEGAIGYLRSQLGAAPRPATR